MHTDPDQELQEVREWISRDGEVVLAFTPSISIEVKG